MTLYYTDVASIWYTALTGNNTFPPYDSDNVDLVIIWTGTCQSASTPAVNDNISLSILVATLVTKCLVKITFRILHSLVPFWYKTIGWQHGCVHTHGNT